MNPLGYDAPRGIGSNHPVIETLVALLLAAALVTALFTLHLWVPGAGEPDWTRGYEPCATEDAPGPCYWDAETMGDGDGDPTTFNGNSFVVEPDGTVTYIDA